MLFFDLVMLLLRKNLYNLSKKAGREVKVFGNEEFKTLNSPTFKFVLFCSFKAPVFVPFGNLLSVADGLAKSTPNPNFELNLRYAGEKLAHWDETYYKAKVPADASKIFVIGSQQFISETKAALTNLKFKPEIITGI